MSNSNAEPAKGALSILDPSVYSQRKFLDYITSLLKSDDELYIENEYEAGNKLAVNSEALPGGRGQKVTYQYSETAEPDGSVTQFTAEFGKAYPLNSENITVQVTRRTYPLSSIEFPEGTPPLDLGENDLSGLVEGDTYSQVVTNANVIDGDGVNMALNGSFADDKGNSGVLQSKITRVTRHFYGLVVDQEIPDNATILSFASNLGSKPSTISVDHGPSPTRLCVVTTDSDLKITASGFEIGMQKYASVTVYPYAADPAYAKTYNIYIQSQGTFNPFTYKVG